MKNSTRKLTHSPTPSRANSVEVVEPNALSVSVGEIQFPKGVETLGEKANFLHTYSVEASKRSTGAAILAGWVLCVARENCSHGSWVSWIEQNVCFSRQTAANYMDLYRGTLGKRRMEARRPVALSVPPTSDELEAAAHDVDGQALSALYKSTRLIARPGDWGGRREGAGHPKKDNSVEAQLDEIAKNETLIWAELKGALDTLVRLDAEKDAWHRLSDEHLSQAVAILAEVAKKSSETMMGRLGK